jgi:hypothetical protein
MAPAAGSLNERPRGRKESVAQRAAEVTEKLDEGTNYQRWLSGLGPIVTLSRSATRTGSGGSATSALAIVDGSTEN